MLPNGCSVDGIAVVGAIRGQADDAALHTSEKIGCLVSVVGVALGQPVRGNLTCGGVRAKGELAPLSAGTPLPLRIPLTLPE